MPEPSTRTIAETLTQLALKMDRMASASWTSQEQLDHAEADLVRQAAVVLRAAAAREPVGETALSDHEAASIISSADLEYAIERARGDTPTYKREVHIIRQTERALKYRQTAVPRAPQEEPPMENGLAFIRSEAERTKTLGALGAFWASVRDHAERVALDLAFQQASVATKPLRDVEQAAERVGNVLDMRLDAAAPIGPARGTLDAETLTMLRRAADKLDNAPCWKKHSSEISTLRALIEWGEENALPPSAPTWTDEDLDEAYEAYWSECDDVAGPPSAQTEEALEAARAAMRAMLERRR